MKNHHHREVQFQGEEILSNQVVVTQGQLLPFTKEQSETAGLQTQVQIESLIKTIAHILHTVQTDRLITHQPFL
jgi:hypothetical protein